MKNRCKTGRFGCASHSDGEFDKAIFQLTSQLDTYFFNFYPCCQEMGPFALACIQDITGYGFEQLSGHGHLAIHYLIKHFIIDGRFQVFSFEKVLIEVDREGNAKMVARGSFRFINAMKGIEGGIFNANRKFSHIQKYGLN